MGSLLHRSSKVVRSRSKLWTLLLGSNPGEFLALRGLCSHSRQSTKDVVDLSQYPTERIRNFSIIAHIDHGKSTLADRLLELTGTIKRGKGQPQYLDKLQVERERGITVKAQTATMFHPHVLSSNHGTNQNDTPSFLLNLIDTPGHVDFSYEVSRSLAACQGALLVVDAAQGVQAQTVANFYLAFESNLTIIPVINKIDQPTADPDRVKAQLKSLFDLDPKDALLTSAKTGQGLEYPHPCCDRRIPSPPGCCDMPSECSCFKPAKHMVFSGLYPADGSDFDALNHAIERLTCNDASVSVTKETSTALGIESETRVISTIPTVPYIFEYSDGRYVGPVITLCSERRGEQLEYSFIDRQMFEITIQAAIGSKVIARETLSAMRKNVLAKCYGGDVSRKKKLLEKQKEGKKRMKRVGSVDIPQEAFHELLKVS
ncbi:hypothetical protein J5N97_013361 [Dioscorea zingiberensis]|uniref:Tr-type G domain-containing protein n=1 Tax=Dioscorea zingiberensis TaxID=325984 RepID=A0A9D5CS12_9LILI|nr:hypothetical protein J5N97_013361 [Dioscorea zingiberensis]